MKRPPVWLGNCVRDGASVVSDGHTMFLLSAVRTNAQRRRLTGKRRVGPVASGRAALMAWKNSRRHTRAVTIADASERLPGLWQDCARVQLTRGKRHIYVDAAKLRLIARCVRWTRATMSDVYYRCPVVFWDGKRPVAMLMPLRTLDDVQRDLPRARVTATAPERTE